MARTKAERRHHARRVKANRKTYNNAGARSPAHIGKVAVTPCLCSCWMCGNRRSLEGLRAASKQARALCRDIVAGRKDAEGTMFPHATRPRAYYW